MNMSLYSNKTLKRTLKACNDCIDIGIKVKYHRKIVNKVNKELKKRGVK
jgi:hypothetical protein